MLSQKEWSLKQPAIFTALQPCQCCTPHSNRHARLHQSRADRAESFRGMSTMSEKKREQADWEILPKCFPYRRRILSISEKDNVPLLAAAALIGCDALLPLVRHFRQANPDSSKVVNGANLALLAAVSADCAACVEALILAAGADPFRCQYCPSEIRSATATHMAAARGKQSALEAILRLDSSKRASDVIDVVGMAPIHVASACGHTEIVRMLVRHDHAAIDVRAHRAQALSLETDEEGHHFGYQDRPHFRDELMIYGEEEFEFLHAPSGPYISGSSPLHFAIDSESGDVIQEIARLAYEVECGPPVRVLGPWRRERTVVIESLQLCAEAEESVEHTFENGLFSNADGASSSSFENLQQQLLKEREGSPCSFSKVSPTLEKEVLDFVNVIVDTCVKQASSTGCTGVNDIVLKSLSVEDILDARTDDNEPTLHIASRCAQKEAILTLVRVGANIYSEGYEMRTVLHSAAECKDPSVIDLIFKEHDFPIDIRDDEGCTPLDLCACFGDGSLGIEKLLSLGSDINSRSYFNNTALQLAIMNGNYDSFAKLLQCGADPNVLCKWDKATTPALELALSGKFDLLLHLLHFAKDGGIFLDLNLQLPEWNTVLSQAVSSRASVDVIKSLLAAGANASIADKNGSTALTEAASKASPDILRLLLEAGANVMTTEVNGWTLLHLATRDNPNIDCMKLLIEYGADVNARNTWGVSDLTPLHVALEEKAPEKVRLLVTAGANCNDTAPTIISPIHFAVEHGDLDSVRTLIEGGADLSVTDDDGWTPLHYAAECTSRTGYLILNALLDAGCPLETRGEYGKTALHIAASEQRGLSSIRLLLTRGAEVNAVSKSGSTALLYASSNGHLQNVCALLEAGADISARNESGEDSILCAAFFGHLNVLIFLKSCGACLDVNDANGRSLFYLAASHGVLSVVQYLLKEGMCSLGECPGCVPDFLDAVSMSRQGELIRLLLEHEHSPANGIAPKFVFSVHSPCVSSEELSKICEEKPREERHEACELDASRETCPICRSLLRNGDEVRTLVCHHRFHSDCLLSWFCSNHRSGQLACPICRQRLWRSEEISHSSDYSE